MKILRFFAWQLILFCEIWKISLGRFAPMIFNFALGGNGVKIDDNTKQE